MQASRSYKMQVFNLSRPWRRPVTNNYIFNCLTPCGLQVKTASGEGIGCKQDKALITELISYSSILKDQHSFPNNLQQFHNGQNQKWPKMILVSMQKESLCKKVNVQRVKKNKIFTG